MQSLLSDAIHATKWIARQVLYDRAAPGAAWLPIDELNQTDSDLTLLFLAGNSIRYDVNVSDPWFSANAVYGDPGSSYIAPDLPVSRKPPS